MLTNIKTVFIDFDGTLHDSIKIYKPAFIKAYQYLVAQHVAKEKVWAENEISKWLGYNRHDMWKDFMPHLDENHKQVASKIIGDDMLHQIEVGTGNLYPDAIELLKYLKDKNYMLVLLSNCGTYYKNLIREYYQLDNYFTDIICAQEYGYIPKYQILKKIKQNYKKNMVVIGDRIHDIESGIKNKIYTIGCKYGYGTSEELLNADYVVDNLKEIKMKL